MDRSPCERHAPLHMLSSLVPLSLVAGMLAFLGPAAEAAVNTCRARNVTQGTPSNSNLQAAIDDAHPGDAIAVRGVCVGDLEIGKRLTLVGRATADVSRPVLRGSGTTSVLLVSAPVTLTNLRVAGGGGDMGGGISNSGTLTLKDSVVRQNTSRFGGGGIYNIGNLVLSDSTVRGNAVPHTPGGGIWNDERGRLTLNGSSEVTRNQAKFAGGIENAGGTLIMNDSSRVTKNSASHGRGGGIFSYGAVIMNDSSRVSGNRASAAGGGIAINGGTVTMNGSSSVTRNRADFDDNGIGTGGGIKASGPGGGTVMGAVDGGNVNNNYLGRVGRKENNIAP